MCAEFKVECGQKSWQKVDALKNKALHEAFAPEFQNVVYPESWKSLRNRFLKKEKKREDFKYKLY